MRIVKFISLRDTTMVHRKVVVASLLVHRDEEIHVRPFLSF